MMMLAVLMTGETFLAPERHRDETRHVKSGASSRNRSDQPNQPTEWNLCRRRRIPKNFIFRPEAAERNDAADCQPARKKSPVRVRHVLAQIAHLAHVLLVMHAMDYATCSEEHQRFEERVRHHMKGANDEPADTARQKHEAKLRHRRVSKNFLYIVLG